MTAGPDWLAEIKARMAERVLHPGERADFDRLISEAERVHEALRQGVDADGQQLWDEHIAPEQAILNVMRMAGLRLKQRQ